MRLDDLAYVQAYALPTALTLYRVQRATSRRHGVVMGSLTLAPAGTLGGRFDLVSQAVGYFAEAPETALYEALARREATGVSLALVAQRRLLALQVRRSLQLADIRPHASSWPVLQSLRLGLTQQLAADAERLGFEGIVYRSAQQYGHDCYAIFGSALGALRRTSLSPLVSSGGGLHRSLAAALMGSQVPLLP